MATVSQLKGNGKGSTKSKEEKSIVEKVEKMTAGQLAHRATAVISRCPWGEEASRDPTGLLVGLRAASKLLLL